MLCFVPGFFVLNKICFEEKKTHQDITHYGTFFSILMTAKVKLWSSFKSSVSIHSSDVNECDPDPCQNGASCRQGLATFECICPPGFQGTLCEEGNIIPVLTIEINLGSRWLDFYNLFFHEIPQDILETLPRVWSRNNRYGKNIHMRVKIGLTYKKENSYDHYSLGTLSRNSCWSEFYKTPPPQLHNWAVNMTLQLILYDCWVVQIIMKCWLSYLVIYIYWNSFTRNSAC